LGSGSESGWIQGEGGGHKWQMFAARQQLGLELITMQLNNTINAIKITIKHAA